MFADIDQALHIIPRGLHMELKFNHSVFSLQSNMQG